VTTGSERETTYHCVVGHEIPAAEVDIRTEVWRLDAGADVRVCLEHGAPIAITQQPVGGESRPA
jgi:hypothetical protein